MPRSEKMMRVMAFVVTILVISIAVTGALLFLSLLDNTGDAQAQESGHQNDLFNDAPLDDRGNKSTVDPADGSNKLPVTAQTQEMLDLTISQYLSRGDFLGLDRFLAAQKALYRSSSGEESANIADWDIQFDMLRGDLTTTMNLSPENASQVMSTYSSAEILAAAIAYSPISVKKDVFLDWSAAILPAVPSDGLHDIGLKKAGTTQADPVLLNQLRDSTDLEFSDLVAYDMSLFGYGFRLYLAANEFGYYLPLTLINTDGLMPDPPTRSEIEAVKSHLDPYTSIDDVFIIPELKQSDREGLGTP